MVMPERFHPTRTYYAADLGKGSMYVIAKKVYFIYNIYEGIRPIRFNRSDLWMSSQPACFKGSIKCYKRWLKCWAWCGAIGTKLLERLVRFTLRMSPYNLDYQRILSYSSCGLFPYVNVIIVKFRKFYIQEIQRKIF